LLTAEDTPLSKQEEEFLFRHRTGPACPVHGLRMVQNGGKKGDRITYLYCPVDGCEHSRKLVRPAVAR